MIRIGTSGWMYKHWHGPFYPQELKVSEWFDYYQKYFDTVELNTTFYHLPKIETIQKWSRQTAKEFCFVLKASRYITHNKKLSEPKESVKIFFDRIKPLKSKTEIILFQLPPSLKINLEKLEGLLEVLPKSYRYTFEFRHPSWFENTTYKILEKYNIALCIYELAGFLSPIKTTADFVYVRLHGPSKRKYSGDYDTNTLAEWANYFQKWQNEGRDVFCYFDNDQLGYAVKNALELKKLVC